MSATGASPGRPLALCVNGGFATQPLTGVQRYSYEIARALREIAAARAGPAVELEILIRGTAVAADYADIRPAAVPTPGLPRALWAQTVLPYRARGVLVSLGNVGPLACRRHILCLHDVNTLLAPESYTRAYRVYQGAMGRLLGRTARIVTVSEFSAGMLRARGIVGPDRPLDVIPNGHEHALRWRPCRSRYHRDRPAPRPYVLVIGSPARHKNVGLVLDAAPGLDARGIDVVVCGRGQGPFARRAEGREPGRAGNVVHLDGVGDDDLAALYRGALCLAFPSLTEGFGLPVLEAMALGCPVVCSTAASLPWVGGDAVLYADPRDPREWLDRIAALGADANLGRRCAAAGLARAGRFSWRRSAERYVEIAADLAGSRGEPGPA